MIRHIVILHFRKNLYNDYLSLLEKTIPFVNEIPGIIKYQIFINKSKYIPKDVYSLGIEIIFKDENALDIFMNHPNHYKANSIFEKYLDDPPYMVLTHEI